MLVITFPTGSTYATETIVYLDGNTVSLIDESTDPDDPDPASTTISTEPSET